MALKQDFLAKIFSLSYCAVLAFPIEERVRQESERSKTKHRQKINITSSRSMLKSIVLGILSEQQVEKAIQAFDNIVYSTREIIRPGINVKEKTANEATSLELKGILA